VQRRRLVRLLTVDVGPLNEWRWFASVALMATGFLLGMRYGFRFGWLLVTIGSSVLIFECGRRLGWWSARRDE
jgi:hypothetical protein